MPERCTRYLLDNTLFIAAVKRGWTKSTELIYNLLDSPVELFANKLLIFEYEKYANTLNTHELLNHLEKIVISELSDIVHAATCLSVGAILITNDNHSNNIKKARLVEVWSITKAIKRLLEEDENYGYN